MARKRKNYTLEQKVMILKKHLLEKVPVSDLCDQYDLHPNVFCRWQKQFFEKSRYILPFYYLNFASNRS